MKSKNHFCFSRNVNRLAFTAAALFCGATIASEAAVIDFGSAEDLLRFNQQPATNFWSYSANGGRDGGGGLVGLNTKAPGWAVLSQGFDAQTPNLSAGIYFKLVDQDASASGYSLSFGITSSPTYASSVVASPGDAGLNHYAGVIQYNSSVESRQHRLVAHAMKDGALTMEAAAYTPLPKEAWYYLALDSTFNKDTGNYSMTVTLYATEEGGAPGASVMSVTMNDFSIPALSDASTLYFFFGMDGRAATRGIGAIDGLTYDVELIPEPGVTALLGGAALVGAAAAVRRREVSMKAIATALKLRRVR